MVAITDRLDMFIVIDYWTLTSICTWQLKLSKLLDEGKGQVLECGKVVKHATE